jgi:uncharacterized protein
MVTDKLNLNGLPVLNLYNPEQKGRSPLIIILHGLGGNKEQLIEHANKFVRLGFYISVFDLHRHGAWNDSDFNRLTVFEMMGDIYSITFESLKYLEAIINYHSRTAEIDINRTGLMGISLGGNIIYHYIAKEDQRVRAAVPMITTPKVGDSLRDMPKNFPEISKRSRDFAEETKKAAVNQPYNKLKTLKDFPLLMLNSDEDPFWPTPYVRDFYNEVLRNYTDPEKIKLIEYPGIGHNVTDDMITQAGIWFKKYL